MANAFAVIETGGKQYTVSAGKKIQVEKLKAGDDRTVVFDKVLLRAEGGQIEIGAPHVSGAKVHGKVLHDGRGEKKIVFKYHSKTRQRKKKGHRQEFTELEITKV